MYVGYMGKYVIPYMNKIINEGMYVGYMGKYLVPHMHEIINIPVS